MTNESMMFLVGLNLVQTNSKKGANISGKDKVIIDRAAHVIAKLDGLAWKKNKVINEKQHNLMGHFIGENTILVTKLLDYMLDPKITNEQRSQIAKLINYEGSNFKQD